MKIYNFVCIQTLRLIEYSERWWTLHIYYIYLYIHILDIYVTGSVTFNLFSALWTLQFVFCLGTHPSDNYVCNYDLITDVIVVIVVQPIYDDITIMM